MTAAWPLTGRSPELEELGRHYRDPSTAGVVLHGPAGVGKTRLAEEALRLAERGGRPVARAVGHPTTRAIPFGALAHLLPADFTTELGGDDDRTNLFHAARAELRRLAGDDRLVLLVDDLDLLDDTSVAVLVPLVVSRTVFLVSTVRAGRSPSARLGALERDGHLARMEIGPLGTDELGALLHRVLDGPVSNYARDELARLSGGNLQVLTELVRGARHRGVLVDVGVVWDLTAPLPTTAALEELVADHLSGVAPAGLEVLELLAVCERLGLADLERVCGAETLEALEASNVITLVTSGRRVAVRLAHPLYGEVLRAGLAPLRLRRIQSELADIVEAHGARRREDIVQVALWRVASGGRVRADHLGPAVRLALAGHDASLAIRLLETAEADVLAPLDRAELLVDAHSMRGELEDLERVVAAVWDDPGLADARRVHLSKCLADTRFSRGRDLAGALAAHDAARERITDERATVAVDVHRAVLLAWSGRPVDALHVMDVMGPVEDPRVQVELDGARAASLLSIGQFEEGRVVARRAADEQTRLPGFLARRGIAQHVLNEAHALAYAGHYREAREVLAPAAERAWATSALGAWMWFELALAEVERDTGRAREAIRRFQLVADSAQKVGQDAVLIWAHVGVAQGHLLLGQCARAADALDKADRVGDSPVGTSFGTRERGRAWLDACRGDLPAARDRLRRTIDRIQDDGVLIFELALTHDLVRLGVPAEALGRIEELCAAIDGPLAAAHLVHARAMVEGDVAAQQDAVDRYEAIDALSLAAEAAAELADLHRSRAEARAATAAAQRSGELAERAGGVWTPPMARGSGVEPLTGREREIALLAAAGRSSKAIAQQLEVSTRTVDTHLTRVYRKLGVAGRTDLRSALDVTDVNT